MSTYNLQWSATRLDKLTDERYAHVFALMHHGEILYIGKSFRADLAQLIPACIQQLDLDHLSLTVYLGRIREVGTGRISGAAVESIHDLLVFARKPRFNQSGKVRYEGAPDFKLANLGWDRLPGKLRAENQMVFVGN
jgi:hypothetical protein